MTIVNPDNPGSLAHLTDHDRREVENFGRFLKEAPPPDCTLEHFRRAMPGWIPYVLGAFFYGTGEAPPVGYEAVPFTAWTMPG